MRPRTGRLHDRGMALADPLVGRPLMKSRMGEVSGQRTALVPLLKLSSMTPRTGEVLSGDTVLDALADSPLMKSGEREVSEASGSGADRFISGRFIRAVGCAECSRCACPSCVCNI
jgi:hypothetical protein